MLRDGSRLRVRPIRAGDKQRLLHAFERLNPESRYRRFMAPLHKLSSTQLAYLTEIDHDAHEAFCALDPETETIVGVARYVRDSPQSEDAELAVAVADDWHRRGIATALMDRLAACAAERGIRRFTASLLAGNEAVLGLLSELGDVVVGDTAQGAEQVSVELPVAEGAPSVQHLLRETASERLRAVNRAFPES